MYVAFDFERKEDGQHDRSPLFQIGDVIAVESAVRQGDSRVEARYSSTLTRCPYLSNSAYK